NHTGGQQPDEAVWRHEETDEADEQNGRSPESYGSLSAENGEEIKTRQKTGDEKKSKIYSRKENHLSGFYVFIQFSLMGPFRRNHIFVPLDINLIIGLLNAQYINKCNGGIIIET